MPEEKEIEEVLKEYPEKQKPNPDLAQDAEALAQTLYEAKRKGKRKIGRFKLVAIVTVCCACALTGILVPVLYNGESAGRAPVYFTEAELVLELTGDIEGVATENRLSICYFSDAQQTYLYRVKETEELVLITQQYFYYDSESIDNIELSICLTNDEFAQLEKFTALDSQKVIGGIAVDYRLSEAQGEYAIQAKCEVNSVRYYWNISALQGEEKLDYYISYLFDV